MRLFGYEHSDLPPQEIVTAKLAEVTVAAPPAELRAMAKFLADCADEMDRMGATYDHVHLSDRIKSFQTSPQFVVVRD